MLCLYAHRDVCSPCIIIAFTGTRRCFTSVKPARGISKCRHALSLCLYGRHGNGETPSVPREGEVVTKEVRHHLPCVMTLYSVVKMILKFYSNELKSSFNILRRYPKIKFGLNNGRKYGLISQLWAVSALPKSCGDPRKSCDPQHLSRAAVWQMCVSNNRAYRSARACPVGTSVTEEPRSVGSRRIKRRFQIVAQIVLLLRQTPVPPSLLLFTAQTASWLYLRQCTFAHSSLILEVWLRGSLFDIQM